MAIVDEWIKVFEALDQLKAYVRMTPERTALTDLARALRHDVRFRALRPRVSLATLCLSHDPNFIERYVFVTWATEKTQYEIGFLDANLDAAEVMNVGDEIAIVADKLGEYVARLEL